MQIPAFVVYFLIFFGGCGHRATRLKGRIIHSQPLCLENHKLSRLTHQVLLARHLGCITETGHGFIDGNLIPQPQFPLVK